MNTPEALVLYVISSLSCSVNYLCVPRAQAVRSSPLVAKEGPLLILPQPLPSQCRESVLSEGLLPRNIQGLRQASRQAPHSSSATAVLPLLPSVLVRTSLLVAGLSPAKALLQSPPPEDLALPLTSYSMSRRSPPLLLHASPWRSPRFSLPKESIVIPASPGSQVSSKDRVLLWHPPSGCRPSPDPIPRILHGTQQPETKVIADGDECETQ